MNLSDTHNSNKIKPGFRVPENYFENLTDIIMAGLPVNDTPVVPIYKKQSTWMAIAAVLVIGLCMSIYFRTGTQQLPDDDSIENYLVYQANLNSYDIAEGLNSNDIAELEASLNTVSNDAIEDYIMNGNDLDNYLNE